MRGVKVNLLGDTTFLGVNRLVPGDLLPGMAGHAAHEREHGALRHPFAVVDHLALSNRREEFIVLDLVHVGVLALVTPLVFALDEGLGSLADKAITLGAHDVV